MTTNPSHALGRHMLHSVGIFQALAALPTAILLGFNAFAGMLYVYRSHDFFYFFSDSVTALMAAGIMFVVVVQRKVSASNFLTFKLEAAKSALATGLWLWLLLDALFGPWKNQYGIDPDRDVPWRVAGAATAAILLFVLFYPALFYSYYLWKLRDGEDDEESRESREENESEHEGRSERTPLLSRSP